ncbi:hypothetical protein DIURU_001745 [Diutina rugosa]|uniref:PQ-loop repeat-containing protein 1 n=1 Tax=Diutina rugosa TaxID=5481 RepID=A0A642UTD2_DIURU|nr:uncharacterized protein DIURU_001745 [Diutina rugosa]KAA8904909.1 hypothetical protein DIURU_001745 [Diutina rugosa]
MSSWVPENLLPYLDYLPDVQKTINFSMAFTPLVSYGTTCYGIYRKQTSTGFSIDICATMLMASWLRILYYIITPYEVTLLCQSMVQMVIQSVLLTFALKYRSPQYDPELLAPMPHFDQEVHNELPDRSNPTNHRLENDYWSDLVEEWEVYLRVAIAQTLRFFDVYYQRPFLFWQWKYPRSYWRFVASFMTIFATSTFLLLHSEKWGTFLGILGLLIESLLPLPQILLLRRLQSVDNFKLVLLFSWYGGDLTKIGYLLYGTNNVSVIFILAALFQMSLDIYIGYQYVYFKYLVPHKIELISPQSSDVDAPIHLDPLPKAIPSVV